MTEAMLGREDAPILRQECTLERHVPAIHLALPALKVWWCSPMPLLTGLHWYVRDILCSFRTRYSIFKVMRAPFNVISPSSITSNLESCSKTDPIPSLNVRPSLRDTHVSELSRLNDLHADHEQCLSDRLNTADREDIELQDSDARTSGISNTAKHTPFRALIIKPGVDVDVVELMSSLTQQQTHSRGRTSTP